VEYVGAIDQGTTSSRFVVVDSDGNLVAKAQIEHSQILPRPGWVEHDPNEIWENTQRVIGEALADLGVAASDLAGVGITNQRETAVVWDRSTGEPVANAIVWQDTRTADLCATLSDEIGEERLRRTTGLPAATYFSGPKVRWLLDSDPGLRSRAERGELAFGTIDAWLSSKLTGNHVTDVTNASRTMLMDLGTLSWDGALCEAIGVPLSMRPDIEASITDFGPCSGVLAGTHLRTMLGDQQAALVGQAAFEPGDAKCTYGTGAFLLVNTGSERVESHSGLLTTVAYQQDGHDPKYALEGAVAVAGSSVQWLRDNLKMFDEASEVEALAASVSDNGDVYFVPAFSGLFAPHWRPDARGILAGMTRFTDRGHIARAVLEATAFQVKDLLDAMSTDTGSEMREMRVDGGMVENGLLMQFQADIVGLDVVVPEITETTVLGAAYGAGINAGVWAGPEDVSQGWREKTRYTPSMPATEIDRLSTGWSKALERSLGWA
jgi:glycerol kinase